jgi:hypothetical protein
VATTKAQRAAQAEALASLREQLAPGDTITCVLRHRSASGMTRAIDFYRFGAELDRTTGKGVVTRVWLSPRIARALAYPFSDRHGAVLVSGCGMDIGFHTVYNLAYTLYRDLPIAALPGAAVDYPREMTSLVRDASGAAVRDAAGEYQYTIREDRGDWLRAEWLG